MFASGTCKGGIIASISVGMGMTTFASLSEGQGAPMDGQASAAQRRGEGTQEAAERTCKGGNCRAAFAIGYAAGDRGAPPNAKCARRHRL